MKRFICLCIGIIGSIVFAGCSADFNKKDMNQIDMIRLLGVDYDGEEYQITAMYGIGGSDTLVEGVKTIEGTGGDIFSAFENMKSKNSKDISLAYTGFYLVGEKLANHDVGELIDFLMRDENIKVNALIFLTKENDAKDIIMAAEKDKVMIQDNLDAMVRKRLQTIKENENTVLGIYNRYCNNEGSMTIPYLLDGEDGNLKIGGYAGLRNGRLIQYLDYDSSIGVDILRNNAKSISCSLNNGVSITMNNIKVKKEVNLNRNSIEVLIDVNFDSVLRDTNYRSIALDRKLKEKIRAEQNLYMHGLLEAAALTMKKINVDAEGISELLREETTIWEVLDGHYDDFLKYLSYSYTITSRLVRANVVEGGY